MVFSSILFLFLYLPLTLAAYFFTPRKWRNLMLLVVNLIFYAWGEPVYVLIMIFSILVDYTCGRFIEKFRGNQKRMRLFVTLSVVINLGMLIFFKYYDFLIATIKVAIPGLPLQPMGIPLPIGISFYTFQTMSYTIDVYRGDADAQKSIVDFGTFVTLFPQLIAGPIIKYKDVDDQLQHRRESIDQFAAGVKTFVCGLCKKVLLANSIGMLWDTYKVMPAGEMSALGAWLGILAFSFQIYFDFSGYSDMAIGLGRMLGFEFKINFDYPYISRSATEFWRRWHISLGSWFREYVYIPLGGNRKGTFNTYRNILIVWAATGIWHGANWTFMLWGLMFAAALMLEKAFLLKTLDRIPRFIGHTYTLLLVIFSWVVFALDDLKSVGAYFGAMFGGGDGLINSAALYSLRLYLPLLIVLCIASTPLMRNVFNKITAKHEWIAPVLCGFGLIISTAYLVDATYNPFLYFRF